MSFVKVRGGYLSAVWPMHLPFWTCVIPVLICMFPWLLYPDKSITSYQFLGGRQMFPWVTQLYIVFHGPFKGTQVLIQYKICIAEKENVTWLTETHCLLSSVSKLSFTEKLNLEIYFMWLCVLLLQVVLIRKEKPVHTCSPLQL